MGNPTRLRYLGDHTGIHVIVDEATFTPFGEVQTRRFGASNERHAYQAFIYEEGTRRLERATFDREASLHAVADLRYTYDHAGNITSIADLPEDLPGNHELQCFQYDYQRRLVEAWAQGDTTGCETTPTMDVLGGPAPYWQSYDHDVTGNRTSETLRIPGQPSDQRTYTYPPAGQPQPHTLQTITATSPGGQASYDYDPAGNTTARTTDGQTQTLTWNTEGNLESVEQDGEQPVRMVYDTGGNRLIRDDGDTVTAFMPQTELTWHRDSDTLEGTRYFTHAGQVVAVCTGHDVADWTWMGVDHHGTTTTHAVNAFTAVEQVRRTDPYGNPRGPRPHAWPGQQTFAGGVQDPTGLIHIGARSYDPATGRFISVDAILAIGDDQQINGYAYAHNNPISATDPTGMRDYWNSVNGTPCIDGDCSHHNPNGSLKNPNQCKATGGCGRGPGTSTASAGSNAGSTAPSRQPTNIVNEILEHGTTYVLDNDGRILLNGVVLPEGAPPGAELAPLVDQVIFENGLRPDEVLLAVSWLCADRVIECDTDFLTAVWTRDVAEGLGADSFLEAMAIGGGYSLLKYTGGPSAVAPRRGGAGCNSFESGTLVLMADGATKPISEIEPGDQVLAADPETSEQSSQTVTAVWAHDDILFDLQIQAPWGQPSTSFTTTGATVATISTTADHPFWNHTDQQWQPARTLDPGDQLLSSDGSVAAVAGLLYHTRRSTAAYNVTVANIHTYYVLVGSTSLLVHNADGCGGPLPTQVTGRTQRLTNAQATDLANYLGYRYTGRTLRGERVFTNGKMYIVQDTTSHAGGTWKIAGSIPSLSSKATRTATTDALLNQIGR